MGRIGNGSKLMMKWSKMLNKIDAYAARADGMPGLLQRMAHVSECATDFFEFVQILRITLDEVPLFNNAVQRKNKAKEVHVGCELSRVGKMVMERLELLASGRSPAEPAASTDGEERPAPAADLEAPEGAKSARSE